MSRKLIPPAKNAPQLRWLCTPAAGVNQFAAHILMVTLEMLRCRQAFAGIVILLPNV